MYYIFIYFVFYFFFQLYRYECVFIIYYYYVYDFTRFSFQVTNRQTTKTRFLYLGTWIQRFLGYCSVHVLVVTRDMHRDVSANSGEMIFDIDLYFLFIYNIIHTQLRIKSFKAYNVYVLSSFFVYMFYTSRE